MSSVLVATLVADPSKAPLSEATLDRAAQALGGVERRRWLDEGVAADLVFTGDLRAKRAALEESLSGESLDIIVQPIAHRRKRLLEQTLGFRLLHAAPPNRKKPVVRRRDESEQRVHHRRYCKHHPF